MIVVGFSLKSQGTDKIKLFSHGTDDSINLKYESLQSHFLGCKIMAESG